MSTRPLRCGMIWRKASPTTRSERVKPGRSAFVESPRKRSTPRFPSSASLPTSVRSPSTGVWSELPVAGVEDQAGRGRDRDADRVGHRACAMWMNSSRKGPMSTGSPSASISRSSVERCSPCSSSFEPIIPSVRRVAQTSRTPHFAQQIRQPADVILVPMGEQDGQHLAVREIAEVGQHEIDAEMLVTRERQARVDDEDLAADLEHGHVLADLAEAAERDHAVRRVRHRTTVYGELRAEICPQAVSFPAQGVDKSPDRGWHERAGKRELHACGHPRLDCAAVGPGKSDGAPRDRRGTRRVKLRARPKRRRAARAATGNPESLRPPPRSAGRAAACSDRPRGRAG